MKKAESVENHGSDEEFEDLLRQSEAQWLAILKETSAQLAKSNPQDRPLEK
jgi:hypothetical protein